MPGWPVAALLLLVLVSTVAAFVPSPALIGRRPVAPTRSSGRSTSSTISTSMASSSIGNNWFWGGGKPDPQTLVRQGMDAFRQGSVQESIDLFDQALALDRRIQPYLWQRCVTDAPPCVIMRLPHDTIERTTTHNIQGPEPVLRGPLQGRGGAVSA